MQVKPQRPFLLRYHSLLLLAVLLLALALARPFLQPSGISLGSTGPVLYGILIENGIGMQRIDAGGPYMEQAREISRLILEKARDQDRFILYNTHGPLQRTGILDRNTALGILDEIASVPSGNYLDQRISGMFAEMEGWSGEARVLYWLTSASPSAMEKLDNVTASDFANQVASYVIPVGGSRASNTFVSGFRMTGTAVGPGRPVNLEVEVSNLGNEAVSNHFVSLEAEGRLAGQYQSDLQPGESATFVFEVIPTRSGDLSGRVLLEGDGFQQDNTWYFSIDIPEKRHILLVTAGRSYLQSVLSAGEQTQGQIDLTTVSLAQFDSIDDISVYDAIVLDGLPEIPDAMQEQIQRFVQSGKGAVVYPSERGNMMSYNRFLSRINAGEIVGIQGEYGSFNATARLSEIIEGHPVLDDIFDKPASERIRVTLPNIYYYMRFRASDAGTTLPILRSTLQDPILLEHRYGNGRVLISLIGNDPGWSAFPGNAIFAPLAYRTAFYAASLSPSGARQHTLGEPFRKEFAFSGRSITISGEDEQYIAEVRSTGTGGILVQYPSVEWKPGLYSVSDGQASAKIAANLDISESDFRTLSNRELHEKASKAMAVVEVLDARNGSAQEVQTKIDTAGFGSEVWNWFIALAFLLLMAELVVSRWYKAETVS